MMKAITFIAFLLVGASLLAQKTPAGYNISDAECASGGDDVYFFEDGRVIAVASGMGTIYVREGSWKMSGKEAKATFTRQYYGEPSGKLLYAASVNVYERYKGTAININEQKSYGWAANSNSSGGSSESGESGESDDNYSDGCATIERHKYSDSDVRQFLRTSFVGKYPQASERLLTESELGRYSASDLRIMRNEIFARYGYTFTTPEMKSYFSKQPNYVGTLSDVTAFLSDTENANVALIKKMEARK